MCEFYFIKNKVSVFVVYIFQYISENRDNFLTNNNQLNNNCQNDFNLERINLKKELVNKNKIIEQQKIEINNLKNQLSSLNNINNNNNLSIQNLSNNININFYKNIFY